MLRTLDRSAAKIARITDHAAAVLLRINRPEWNLVPQPNFGLAEPRPGALLLTRKERNIAFCRMAVRRFRSQPRLTIIAGLDGGARPNPGAAGSGMIVRWDNADGKPLRHIRAFQGIGEASNNAAELYAMLMLQQHLLTFQPPIPSTTPILILSDSQLTINFLTYKSAPNPTMNHPLIHAARNGHDTLCDRFRYVKLLYSPAHVGIYLNEEADRLATKGVKDSQAGRGHTAAELARRIQQNDFSIPPHNIIDLTTLHYRTYLHHHRPP
jgi:ribonuclease HI